MRLLGRHGLHCLAESPECFSEKACKLVNMSTIGLPQNPKTAVTPNPNETTP